jgi:UDP-N-acetylmuramate dehydrogenase
VSAFERLADALRQAGLPVRQDEPLARHTTYRIGGPADLFVTVERREDLGIAVALASQRGAPHLILGSGANLLVGDRGYRGLVICNRCLGVDVRPEAEGSAGALVIAESGVLLATLARQMGRQGLGGLAWAEGIPGSLGGAIVGNAGAYGGSMSDLVVSAECLHRDGLPDVWPAQALGFGYRTSRLKADRDAVVVAATLQLRRSEPAEEERLMREYSERRRERQPVGPSAGSVFKNPAGDSAGRLIEAAGMKGQRVGGALVSPKHANFILNADGATAADVRALMDRIRGEVSRRFGVVLDPEIELIGAF